MRSDHTCPISDQLGWRDGAASFSPPPTHLSCVLFQKALVRVVWIMNTSPGEGIGFHHPIFCLSCPEIFESEWGYKLHVQTHQLPVICCKDCGKRAKNEHGLAMHRKAKHESLPPPGRKPDGKGKASAQTRSARRRPANLAKDQKRASPRYEGPKLLWHCKLCTGSVMFESHGGLKRVRHTIPVFISTAHNLC